jgi:SAM-dependent methyltransferase
MVENERSDKPVQNTDEQHRIKYADAIRDARRQGADAFQDWFNRSQSVEQSFVRGYWDFSIHILTPAVCRILSAPEEKVALEIGYGGGRILNAACGFFGKVIGIDIHEDQDAVDQLLKENGRSNFQLPRADGTNLGVPRESVDIVYSFIVLQHLQSYATFMHYLREIHACLKPNGLAQLYYGCYWTLGMRTWLRSWTKGYHEMPEAGVNRTSLVIRPVTVKREARRLGFRIEDSGRSYKVVPDGYPGKPGGQSYVTLVK